jgi:hypothetical protein
MGSFVGRLHRVRLQRIKMPMLSMNIAVAPTPTPIFVLDERSDHDTSGGKEDDGSDDVDAAVPVLISLEAVIDSVEDRIDVAVGVV